MNERMYLADKMPEVKSQNQVPQIRRKVEPSQSMDSPVDRILFLQRTIGNQAVARLMKSGALKAKLRIGQPRDIYEQEADRVAEHVMRIPDVSSDKITRVQRKCPKCLNGLRGLLGKDKKDEKLQAKEAHGKTAEVAPHTEANINALKGGGQPLPESARAFFEPRFGQDFSQVRVHTDAKAAEAARMLNAQAFTMSEDVVFATGQYSHGTQEGQKLLAHELTHVVQQKQVSYDDGIQRKCGKNAIGPPTPDCKSMLVSEKPKGERFLFKVNCDEFATGQEEKLKKFADTIPANANINILGLASSDGDNEFNESLSCQRAIVGASILTDKGHIGKIRSVKATGGIGVEGDATLRAVNIFMTTPVPVPPKKVPPEEKPFCGPDATDWFVLQLNTASVDPDVRAIRSAMAAADVLARRYGTTASQIAEGGTVTAVLAQEAWLKITGPSPPPRGPGDVITTQIGAGMRARAAASAALMPTTPWDPRIIDTPIINALILSAALGWRALVNHGARYDFKAHVMNHPKTTNCPQIGCDPGEVGIITLCPGTNPQNCYESDLPGNLFYARIGRHVGFSENTLQLGSQYAELTDTRSRPSRPTITWDTPQDTAAINLGYWSLPLRLTRSVFCSVLSPSRATLSARVGCEDCLNPTTARIR